jgi:hypothetical protein
MENEQSFSEFWAISQAQTQFGSIFDLPQIHVILSVARPWSLEKSGCAGRA